MTTRSILSRLTMVPAALAAAYGCSSSSASPTESADASSPDDASRSTPDASSRPSVDGSSAAPDSGASMAPFEAGPSPGAEAGQDAAVAVATSIDELHTIATMSSTVDLSNGDQNPYAIAFAPTTFTGDGVASHVQPGDLLVSNFSDSMGAQFKGTTFEAIRQGGPVHVFAETNAPAAAGGTVSSSGPVALAFAPNGNLWIANFGAKGDGTDGNVQIVTPAGVVAKTFADPSVIGGWGQEFNHKSEGRQAFFTVNIVGGSVARINIILSDAGPPSFTIDPLTGDLGHTSMAVSGTPSGPGGLVHDPTTDTLYIVDGYTNTIVAIADASTTTTLTAGTPIYQGSPLNQPAMMTRNPLNGDLIVANQLDNRLVEITTTGHLVATKVVDPTPVTASGAGSALFGLAAKTDAQGDLAVYFVDDNDNTVKALSR